MAVVSREEVRRRCPRHARCWASAGAVMALTLAAGCARPGAGDAQAGLREEAEGAASRVRRAAVAGAFYPGDAGVLKSFVARELEAASVPRCPGRVVGLIAPHAGYEFSGAVAAHAYKTVEGLHYDVVVLVGPSHRMSFKGAVLPESRAWETPLGVVEVDQDLAEELVHASPSLFVNDDRPHAQEHSLEVQLPFVQVALVGAKILPVLIHDFSPETCKAVADALVQAVTGKKVLLVASTDLAHYPSSDRCRDVDLKTVALIERADVEGLYAWEEKATREFAEENVACAICGLGPVAVVLSVGKQLGLDRIVRLKYANSGQVNPATIDRSVGYAALALCASKLPPAESGKAAGRQLGQAGEAKMSDAPLGSADNLTDEQKKRLLVLAREAITRWVRDRSTVEVPMDDLAFREPRAVFVTLRKGNALRGCIGTLEPVAPLGEAVVDSAVSAATRDPRFRPVGPDEVANLDIHISVLSPLRTVSDPREIVLGKHGIVVRRGYQSGVFLPEVPLEQGWDLETTLSILCVEKAGLPADAWKRGAELRVFTTQSFGEEEYGLGPHARH